jgi:hypothetical protein
VEVTTGIGLVVDIVSFLGLYRDRERDGDARDLEGEDDGGRVDCPEPFPDSVAEPLPEPLPGLEAALTPAIVSPIGAGPVTAPRLADLLLYDPADDAEEADED